MALAYDETYFSREVYSDILRDPYDENSRPGARYNWIIAQTSIPAANSSCLDLGCGLGQGTWVLSKYSRQVTGVDFSEFAIEFARKHYGNNGIEFILSSLDDLPLQSQYDYIYCVHVLEHLKLDETERILVQLKRLCHHQSLLIISMPTEGSFAGIYGRRQDLRKKIPPFDPTHISFFSVNQLLKMFDRSGFRIIKNVYILFPSKKLRSLMSGKIVPDFIKKPFAVEGLFVLQIK